jgi:hypothetical protein
VHGDLIVVSTIGGLVFYQGNNDWMVENIHLAGSGAIGRLPPGEVPAIVRDTADMSEADRERYFYRRGLEYIRAHPWSTLRTMAYKSVFFFAPGPLIFQGTPLGWWWSQAPGWLLRPWVAVGAWLVAHKSRSPLPKLPLAIIGYLVLMMMLFRHDNRYRAAVEPFLLMLAAVGLAYAYSALRGIRLRSR